MSSVAAELLDASAARPLVFEAAYDPNLSTFRSLWDAQQRLHPPDCHFSALAQPQLVRELHDLYLDAGCDVLQTHSWFYPFGPDSGEPGLELLTANAQQAAQVACEAAAGCRRRAGRPCWTAGIVPAMSALALNIGDPTRAFTQSRAVAEGLIGGGADLLVVALANGTLDAQAHLSGTLEACDAANWDGPVFVSIEVQPLGLLSGDDVGETLSAIEQHSRVFSVGAYLTTDLPALPEEHFAAAVRRKPTHVFADAGYTSFNDQDGSAVGSLTPADYGRAVAAQARRLGLRFIGGGWGLTPAHIRALRAALSAPATA